MSRIQLALNVGDLDAAVAFYSELFRAAPAKRRPGYANFALENPALKLVLIENAGAVGTLNHLGVEVASTEDVVAETRRLAAAGLTTRVEEGTTCCYALQDKVWVSGPGGQPWEIYTVLADAGADLEGQTARAGEPLPAAASGSGCCGASTANATAEEAAAAGSCCA